MFRLPLTVRASTVTAPIFFGGSQCEHSRRGRGRDRDQPSPRTRQRPPASKQSAGGTPGSRGGRGRRVAARRESARLHHSPVARLFSRAARPYRASRSMAGVTEVEFLEQRGDRAAEIPAARNISMPLAKSSRTSRQEGTCHERNSSDSEPIPRIPYIVLGDLSAWTITPSASRDHLSVAFSRKVGSPNSFS